MKKLILVACAIAGLIIPAHAWTAPTEAQLHQIHKIILDVLHSTYDCPEAFWDGTVGVQYRASEPQTALESHFRDMKAYSGYPWNSISELSICRASIQPPIETDFRNPETVARTILIAINAELPELDSYTIWVFNCPDSISGYLDHGKITLSHLK